MMLRLLPIAVLLSSAASLALELTIVRLGAPWVGQSLLPWSAAIASVLLGLTAGHLLGGRAAGPAPQAGTLLLWLAAAWGAAGAATLATPFLVMPVAEATSPSGIGTITVLSIAALACPPSIAAGFTAPLALRIASLQDRPRIAHRVGAIYAASALGSVLGTVAAGYAALEILGATRLAFVIAAVWIGLALSLLWRQLAVPAFTAIAGAATLALAIAWIAETGPCVAESRYTCVRLLDRTAPGGGLIRFMILDDGVHSAADRDDPRRMHLGYAGVTDRLASGTLRSSAAPAALVIGGGGASLPRAWAAASPDARITAVELDAKVAALAASAMWAGGLPNLTTMIGDGRAVLRTLPPAAYDVVLMDAYRTRSVPPHLVTQEFSRAVAARLKSDGVYLSNIIDRAERPLLVLSIATTLATIFPAVDIWAGDATRDGLTNLVVAAWKDPGRASRPASLSVDTTLMDAGAAPRTEPVTWRRLDIAAARARWPQHCAAVLTDDWAPVDRLIAGEALCGRALERVLDRMKATFGR
jgi:predicted membrane-bound spermidine synthase